MKTHRIRIDSDYGPRKITLGMWVLLVLIMIAALAVPVLITSDSTIIARYYLKKYHEGELCPEDVYATSSFAFVDAEKTREARENAYSSVVPRFSRSLNETLRSARRMDDFARAWSNPSTAISLIGGMLDEEGLVDSRQVRERFLDLGEEERKILVQAARETMDMVMKRGLARDDQIARAEEEGYSSLMIVDDGEGVPGEADISSLATKETLSRSLGSWLEVYTKSIKGFPLILLEDTIRLLASENLLYDENLTTLARERAVESAGEVTVSVAKGERILTRDTVITAGQMEILGELARRRSHYSPLELAGRMVFIIIMTFAFLTIFLSLIPSEHRKYQYLKFALVLIFISQIAMYFLLKFVLSTSLNLQEVIMPSIATPLFISLISGKKRLGAVTAFLLSSHLLLLPGSNALSFFLSMSITCVCVFFFQHPSRKVGNLFHWLYAVIACLFTYIAFTLITEGVIKGTIFASVGVLVANITFSVVAANLILSVVEAVENIPTENRLNELAFTENPVLDRLAQAAQGTYNHSMNVAELAYGCARAIKANAMLARVGGLYHDIGKADYPQYFIENQGEENKQDEIKPSLSVAVIKSHVKTGIEKGREAGLPQEILDIIAQHHGNDVIMFFYRKAQDLAGDEADLVEKSDYRYDGRCPDSRESAIVMICDCVEAASRTIRKPSSMRYEKLVHSLIMSKIEREQLSESKLSLTDLDTIQKTLVTALVAKNHHRIEYPSENGEQAKEEDDHA